MVIPPKYAVSMVAETIKKNTSRSLSRKFTFLKKVYWGRKGIWGKGFFVSTVGINEEVIRKYVQSQSEEETGQVKFDFERTTLVKVLESYKLLAEYKLRIIVTEKMSFWRVGYVIDGGY